VHDVSSFCYVIGVALGVAGYWVPRLDGPAVAAVSLGLLLIGR
jgi:hypothetical protein